MSDQLHSETVSPALASGEAGARTTFADGALELREHGLAVMPTGGEDGKRPLMNGFNRWRKPPSRAAIEEWRAKHPGANIAVLTGLSRVIIVDVDDPALLPAMLERFGETPLIVRTPRPGFQAWYRDPGHVPGSLPGRIHGLPVDIKSGKGIVIVPPSLSPKYRRHYDFDRGGWDDLPSLPAFPLIKLDRPPPTPRTSERENINERLPAEKGYQEGVRNRSLYIEALRRAPLCADADDLAADLSRINAAICRPPVGRDEVRKIAESAMRSELSGTNFVAGSPGTLVPHDLFDDIARIAGKDCAAAVVTWMVLKRSHSHHDQPFAFSPAAMAAKEVIPGIRCRRALERARDILIEAGGLIKAGEKPGRNGHPCSLYRLAKTTRVKMLH